MWHMPPKWTTFVTVVRWNRVFRLFFCMRTKGQRPIQQGRRPQGCHKVGQQTRFCEADIEVRTVSCNNYCNFLYYFSKIGLRLNLLSWSFRSRVAGSNTFVKVLRDGISFLFSSCNSFSFSSCNSHKATVVESIFRTSWKQSHSWYGSSQIP